MGSCLSVRAARSAVLAMVVAAPSVARAEPADPAAEALFQQARAQMAAGQYPEACPKLEESQRLAPAPGTAFNLADCWEHIGRLASAWSLFRDVAAEAKLAQQAARASLARRRADELEPRLPRLIIHVEGVAPGLEVRRDGALVGPAQWDVAVPVDPGAHTVAASAPAHRSWRATTNVAPEAKFTTVVVPALEAPVVDRPAPHAPPGPPAPPAIENHLAPPPPAPPSSSWRAAALVSGAGGVALLLASGVTITVARSMYDGAAPCSGSVCFTTGAVSQRERARSLGNVATGLAIAGGAATAAGVVLWLGAPRAGGAPPEPRPSLTVGVLPAGIVLRRTW
jgi:hypothetical protein